MSVQDHSISNIVVDYIRYKYLNKSSGVDQDDNSRAKFNLSFEGKKKQIINQAISEIISQITTVQASQKK
jgi:hypothetical protein